MNTPASGEMPTDDVQTTGETPEPQPNDQGATPETPAVNEPAKTPEELQAEIDALKGQLSTVNRESAGRRKKLEALEAEDQQRKDARLSEVEREKKRADDAEKTIAAQTEKLRRFSVLDATRAAAQKQNLTLNEVALQDAYAAGVFNNIELDEDGQAQGVDARLKELVKERPYLLQQQQTQAPEIGSQRNGKATDVMTDDEFETRAQRLGISVPRRNK